MSRINELMKKEESEDLEFKNIVHKVSEKTLYRELQNLVNKRGLKNLVKRKGGSMNCDNRHLLDIIDIFRTFIGHNDWQLSAL